MMNLKKIIKNENKNESDDTESEEENKKIGKIY